MSNANWFSEGLDSAEQVIQQEAEEKRRRKNLPRRFFVKQGMEATVMFIDDNGFSVFEHIPFIPGKMGNEFTCSAPSGQPCAGCEKGVWQRYHTFFTILDLTAYPGKNGTIVNERRLLASHPEFTLKVRNWKNQPGSELLRWKQGTLKARKFTVFRSAADKDNIAASGWTPVPEPPLTKEILETLRDGQGNPVYPNMLVPFDYKEVLRIIPYEEQLVKLQGHVSRSWGKKDGAVSAPAGASTGAPPQGGASLPQGASADDDVPF